MVPVCDNYTRDPFPDGSHAEDQASGEQTRGTLIAGTQMYEPCHRARTVHLH